MRRFGAVADDRFPIRRRRRRELGFVLSAVAVLLFVGMMLGAASATFIIDRQQTPTEQKV